MDRDRQTVTSSAFGGRAAVAAVWEEETGNFTATLPVKPIQLAQQARPRPANDLIITLLDQAMERLSQGDPVSALAFYEEAARMGNSAAAVLAARMISPLSQGRPDMPADPVKTYELYHLAVELGLPDARAELTALEAWAEKHASRGDPDAQAVVERMKALDDSKE